MIGDSFERVMRFIGLKSYAYKRLFRPENEGAKEVLRDLAKFCRAHKTTYHSDPKIQSTLEGRREVWLRIQEHLQLSDQQLFDLHEVKHIPARAKEK